MKLKFCLIIGVINFLMLVGWNWLFLFMFMMMFVFILSVCLILVEKVVLIFWLIGWWVMFVFVFVVSLGVLLVELLLIINICVGVNFLSCFGIVWIILLIVVVLLSVGMMMIKLSCWCDWEVIKDILNVEWFKVGFWWIWLCFLICFFRRYIFLDRYGVGSKVNVMV